MIFRHLLIALLTAGIMHCTTPHTFAEENHTAELQDFNDIHVSIARLIAHPERYHGKRVAVIGYVRVNDDTPAVYLSKDDGQYAILKNGLQLKTNGRTIKSKFEKKYCLLIGKFEANRQSQSNYYSGAIKHISKLAVWQADSDDSSKFKKNQLRNIIFSRSRY